MSNFENSFHNLHHSVCLRVVLRVAIDCITDTDCVSSYFELCWILFAENQTITSVASFKRYRLNACVWIDSLKSVFILQMCSLILFILSLFMLASPVATAETLCGGELVDTLQFVCGENGFYISKCNSYSAVWWILPGNLNLYIAIFLIEVNLNWDSGHSKWHNHLSCLSNCWLHNYTSTNDCHNERVH